LSDEGVTLESIIRNHCNDKRINAQVLFFKFNQKLIQVQMSSLEEDQILLLTFSDITTVRNLETYTKKVKNLYLASVAHELRTPINSILPMAEALKGQVNEQKQSLYINVIISSTKHLQHVIDDALDISRFENGAFQVD